VLELQCLVALDLCDWKLDVALACGAGRQQAFKKIKINEEKNLSLSS
jgi:hypothetical protein